MIMFYSLLMSNNLIVQFEDHEIVIQNHGVMNKLPKGKNRKKK